MCMQGNDVIERYRIHSYDMSNYNKPENSACFKPKQTLQANMMCEYIRDAIQKFFSYKEIKT